MSNWPKWEDISDQARARLNNGVGPDWLPDFIRRFLTWLGELFFVEAEWAHHDYGYWKGADKADRKRCDWLFFMAMIRDARTLPPLLCGCACLVSLVFWIAVRLGGWSSFAWGPQEPPTWVFY